MAKVIGPVTPQELAANQDEIFRSRYVWQWPIRLWHWVNVICVSVLFYTGLYISQPVLVNTGEPWNHFFMGKMREVHFAFAFVFVVNFIWRMYWFWMGNNYARSGFPFIWRASWWRDLFRQAWDYLALKAGHVHLGHNALAGLSYTILVIALGWAQVITGFALYSESSPGGFTSKLFGWVFPLVGGSFQVRMWHHLFAWFFLFFGIIHIYIVIYDGQVWRNGLVSSMITGSKFYKEGDLDSDSWLS